MYKNYRNITVTFDTNTLEPVLNPECSQRENKEDAKIVRKSIISGEISGFFCETLITLEGITKKDRPTTMASFDVFSSVKDNSANTATISIGIKYNRPLLNIKHEERIKGALDLNILPLRTGFQMGNIHLDKTVYPSFKPEGGINELVRCMEKINDLEKILGRWRVGKARAIFLGKRLTCLYGDGTEELFHKGLGRAQTKSEKDDVSKAIAEWADGDSISSHYGFGIDLFCSEDFGSSSKKPSVLDNIHRQWLSTYFGIKFVTLSQLAKILIDRTSRPSLPDRDH